MHQLTTGMAVAPHHRAAAAGAAMLREGASAIEATIAMAAMISVVYPHMTGIGGDAFWLIAAPGEAPIAIDGAGRAAGLATIDLYRNAGLPAIPTRGPMAANISAGAIASWTTALALAEAWRGKTMPLSQLLAPAIAAAAEGITVTRSQAALTRDKFDELCGVAGFTATYAPGGTPPAPGATLRFPALARTLERLTRDGLEDFYQGSLARDLAAGLEAAGSPLRLADLQSYRAQRVKPLEVRINGATLFNHPPPTQGLASLLILALFDRLGVTEGETFAHLHGLIEATKQAFLIRDREITDPNALRTDPASFLTPACLDALATQIDPRRAAPWPAAPAAGDTVWLGAIDAEGRAVSMIQSVYFEFGSGLVLPGTGITWQNRGAAFSLDPQSHRALHPGRKPFHTLNPALARFDDGRTMVYGTMGGEGQPQTQAAIFTRYARFGMSPAAAIAAPRWLLGRTWGAETMSLKLESSIPAALTEQLRAAGHAVELVPPVNDMMGHAGMIIRHPDGRIEGASDPRCDGAAQAAAF